MEITLTTLSCAFNLFLILVCSYLGFLLWTHTKSSDTERNAIRRQRDSLMAEIDRLRGEHQQTSFGIWLSELGDINYQNEMEVEAKFVYPLIRFLGYAPNSTQMQKTVYVQVGRQRKRGYADWLLLKNGSPHIVIETKAANHILNADVQDQARSYTLNLKASKYMLTNGKRIKVFDCGVQHDQLLIECEAQEIGRLWNQLRLALR